MTNADDRNHDAADIFDRPCLWRIEAATVLGLEDDDLPAAMSSGPSFPALLHSVAQTLPDSVTTMVDLGAGGGGASEWMRRATGAAMVAVEPAPRARLAAQLAFPQLAVIEGSAEHTPLPDGSANVVTLWGVASLLRDLEDVLAEVDRLLVDDGLIVVADLFSSTSSTWETAANRFRSFEDVAALLADRRFDVVSMGCGAPVLPGHWGSITRRVDEWITENCSNRSGYRKWRSDKDDLAELVDLGRLLGGAIVAQRKTESGAWV